MMFLQKDKVILSMKCVAALFLAFMFTGSVKFMINMRYENLDPQIKEEIIQSIQSKHSLKYVQIEKSEPSSTICNSVSILDLKETNEEKDLCNTYWLFLVYAFVLGAFWNVKKIRKVGIV
jgi:hypothetical protein